LQLLMADSHIRRMPLDASRTVRRERMRKRVYELTLPASTSRGLGGLAAPKWLSTTAFNSCQSTTAKMRGNWAREIGRAWGC
jgi:hypothetical protein